MNSDTDFERCKNDPVYFAQFVLGVELYDYQKRLLTHFHQLDMKRNVSFTPSRWSGRTFCNKLFTEWKRIYKRREE